MSNTSMESAENSAWLAVRNEEGRHSIWPVDLSLPHGWSEAGYRGDKSGCLEWISENWADSRPAGVGLVRK